MAEGPDLESRVQEETANIKVASYQKVASLGGWAGGSRTLWAVAAVGAACGALIGVVAPFFPLIAGAGSLSAALGAVGSSVVAFSAAGMSMGFGGGLVLGRISGAAASVAEENEKRMKEWTARQLIAANPNAKIVPDAPKAPAPKKSFWQRTKESYHTYINPRVGLAMAAIGVVGGLIMAAAFLSTGGLADAVMPLKMLGAISGVPEAFTIEAIKAAPAAFIAYTTGVMAVFGSLWGLNLTRITSETTHFFGVLISGKPFGRGWEIQPEKAPEQAPQVKSVTVEERSQPAPNMQVRQFASYTEMVSKNPDELTLTR